jgi:hypothetical protein
MPTRRVFLSYSLADRGIAREVAEDLRAHGVSVWIDESELHAGERAQEAIRTQLDQADAFLLLIGRDSQHSQWARYEMSEVLKRTWSDPSRLVVAVLIGDAQLPGYLRDHDYLRLDPTHSPDVFKALLDDLSKRQTPGGIHRTAAGDVRLDERLAELQRTAASISDTEDER